MVDQRQFFLDWARSLEGIGLKLVWHDIQFVVKHRDGTNNFTGWENPDTTNGNLKFWFVFNGEAWTPNI